MKRRQLIQSAWAGSAIGITGLFGACATPMSGPKVVVVGGGYGAYVNGASATNVALNLPNGCWIDKNNYLYIADTGNHVITKVTNGIITILAGVYGHQGYSGDNELSMYGKLNNPMNIFEDNDGNFYVSDSGNNCIRKLSYQCDNMTDSIVVTSVPTSQITLRRLRNINNN